MRRFILAFVLLLSSSCLQYGMETFDCKDGLEDLDLAVERIEKNFPGSDEIIDRLDIMCKEDVSSKSSGCWTDKAVACTVWEGSAQMRARVYVKHGTSVSRVLIHEAQHWNGNYCYEHDESCWDFELEERLQEGIR